MCIYINTEYWPEHSFDSLNAKVAIYIETSQMIFFANQLTGFYIMATLAFNELMTEAYSMLCRKSMIDLFCEKS